MLYDKLNETMRQTVDEFAERARSLSWQRISELLGEAAAPFNEQFDESQARLASRGFLTAVLERLDPNAVTTPHQACLFALSLNPAHRQLADSYLDEHPELRELIEGELGDGEPTDGGPPSQGH